KAARHSLTNSPECPEFPEEQWLALLAGKAINLNSIFTSDHSTLINKQKVIKNADKWIMTWYTYIQVVLIAFPHQYQELALYQQYMSSLFQTTALSLHCCVFVLD
ncbi:hypothetical protein ARMGADRAFT_915344, partial [Armillaria gallica]